MCSINSEGSLVFALHTCTKINHSDPILAILADLDLVYVDGTHLAPGVLTDLVLSFKLVRVGGLVICDDYTWADPKHGGKEITGRPKLAIDAFTTIYSDKIQIQREVPIRQVAFVKLSD